MKWKLHTLGPVLHTLGVLWVQLCHYIFFFPLADRPVGRRVHIKKWLYKYTFRPSRTLWWKVPNFFWPHVVPKWNPNIAWGSLSWFRSIRVRGMAVMGVWKCVNNSIYESPVTTKDENEIDQQTWTNGQVDKWPSGSSGVLPPSDCDQNFLT